MLEGTAFQDVLQLVYILTDEMDIIQLCREVEGPRSERLLLRSSVTSNIWVNGCFKPNKLLVSWTHNGTAGKLAASTNLDNFIALLSTEGRLREIEITPDEDHSGSRILKRYVWGEPSPFSIGLSTFKGAYLSHGTAVFLHGLNDQIPQRVIYVNHEQSPKPQQAGELTQGGIDKAFSREQRLSTFSYQYDDVTFQILSGKHTGRFEVGALSLDKED